MVDTHIGVANTVVVALLVDGVWSCAIQQK